MKPLSSAEIRGTWGAILLPVNADDSIDFGAMAVEVDALIEAQLDGIYTNGTSGEFHAQTEDEFDRVSVLVAERCAPKGTPFQLGVCHMSAQISRERLRRAKALSPGAFQVILPDWVPTSPAEAETFLREMAELADPIGLVVYSPAHAKRPLDPATLARLRAAVPGLVGVKCPDGNSSWYASVRRALPGFSVFVPGHHLATGRSQGASGSYSNVACLSPNGAKSWNRLIESDPSAAHAWQQRILSFFQEEVASLASQGYCPAALDKALCAAGDWTPMPSRMRWPYLSVPPGAVEHLALAARRAFPEWW